MLSIKRYGYPSNGGGGGEGKRGKETFVDTTAQQDRRLYRFGVGGEAGPGKRKKLQNNRSESWRSWLDAAGRGERERKKGTDGICD